MDDERRYTGPVAADEAHGLHGGTCALRLAADAFELVVERHWIYGIEDVDTVRGTWVADGDALVLDAHTWQRERTETVTQSSAAALERRWHARLAGPVEDPGAMLALAFALGIDVIDVLLVRAGAAPAHTGLADEQARQAAERAAAARLRNEHLVRRDRRAAESARVFAAGDLASVIALLAPEEADLTRAEAMRLAMARRRLLEP